MEWGKYIPITPLSGHGVAPELLFGPQGVLARGTWWGRRGGLVFLQGGPRGFGGGRVNKPSHVILRLRARFRRLAVGALCAKSVRRPLALCEIAAP